MKKKRVNKNKSFVIVLAMVFALTQALGATPLASASLTSNPDKAMLPTTENFELPPEKEIPGSNPLGLATTPLSTARNHEMRPQLQINGGDAKTHSRQVMLSLENMDPDIKKQIHKVRIAANGHNYKTTLDYNDEMKIKIPNYSKKKTWVNLIALDKEGNELFKTHDSIQLEKVQLELSSAETTYTGHAQLNLSTDIVEPTYVRILDNQKNAYQKLRNGAGERLVYNNQLDLDLGSYKGDHWVAVGIYNENDNLMDISHVKIKSEALPIDFDISATETNGKEVKIGLYSALENITDIVSSVHIGINNRSFEAAKTILPYQSELSVALENMRGNNWINIWLVGNDGKILYTNYEKVIQDAALSSPYEAGEAVVTTILEQTANTHDNFVQLITDITTVINASSETNIGAIDFEWAGETHTVADSTFEQIIEFHTELSEGDADMDGLINGHEILFGTDIFDADTDDNNVPDGSEFMGGGHFSMVDPIPGNDKEARAKRVRELLAANNALIAALENALARVGDILAKMDAILIKAGAFNFRQQHLVKDLMRKSGPPLPGQEGFTFPTRYMNRAEREATDWYQLRVGPTLSKMRTERRKVRDIHNWIVDKLEEAKVRKKLLEDALKDETLCDSLDLEQIAKDIQRDTYELEEELKKFETAKTQFSTHYTEFQRRATAFMDKVRSVINANPETGTYSYTSENFWRHHPFPGFRRLVREYFSGEMTDAYNSLLPNLT